MEKQHGISSKRLFSITPTEISSFSSMETEKSGCFQGRNHGRFYIQQTATTSFIPAKAAVYDGLYFPLLRKDRKFDCMLQPCNQVNYSPYPTEIFEEARKQKDGRNAR